MISVLVYKNGEINKLPLNEYLELYHENPPKGWLDEISNYVDAALNIKNDSDLNLFLSKLNLRWFNYLHVQLLYQNLKKSKYNLLLEDDILKYISYLFGLGCFDRMNIAIDIENPNLDIILNTKFIFHSVSVRNNTNEENMFSFADLIPLKNGMNAIRHELIMGKKW